MVSAGSSSARSLRVVGLTAVVVALLAAPSAAAAAPSAEPVLAYYYIWFNPSSWNRAKTDYPVLGRYSSDERAVMRQHIQWAKAAGIDGFIVSWKSTAILNDRLEKLMQVADEQNFKLAIIYQGLDFARQPLPADRVAADLDFFAERYAADRAFDLFERPLVIWSGTWEFTRNDIARVTTGVRGDLLVLASERNTSGYRRVGAHVDGNAYYWSSVNPKTFPGYPEKLAEFGQVVHADGGLWIAPAAPGFDARLVGGTSIVPRLSGETLRRELDAAVGSSPDAVGVISWNEFSENTHIEPSEKYGGQYLSVLADVLGGQPPVIGNFDSDAPAATGFNYGIPLIAGFGLVLVAGLAVRRIRKPTASGDGDHPHDVEMAEKGVGA